jgi:hypothetical protein
MNRAIALIFAAAALSLAGCDDAIEYGKLKFKSGTNRAYIACVKRNNDDDVTGLRSSTARRLCLENHASVLPSGAQLNPACIVSEDKAGDRRLECHLVHEDPYYIVTGMTVTVRASRRFPAKVDTSTRSNLWLEPWRPVKLFSFPAFKGPFSTLTFPPGKTTLGKDHIELDKIELRGLRIDIGE